MEELEPDEHREYCKDDPLVLDKKKKVDDGEGGVIDMGCSYDRGTNIKSFFVVAQITNTSQTAHPNRLKR